MSHQDTVRLTIDFPADQHAYLKMRAAQKGISMRQYVTESLSKTVDSEESKHIDLSENKFKKAKEKVFKEHAEIIKRLADK